MDTSAIVDGSGGAASVAPAGSATPVGSRPPGAAVMVERLTAAAIRAEVAELVHRCPEDLGPQDLFECGLDSIRLLSLVERWRAAGVEASFVELAERPTLDDWLTLLASRLPAVPDG
ncbi:MAG TPA: phosphopantetheine-binding protein [Actinophytocola sp.]|nr:phosphopantetheine-binding protein [Actinophytocola sp.]